MKQTIRNIVSVSGGAGGVGRRRGAFTLIELLIGVGALAFVAVGVATIFEAVGRTIQAGKRVSAFNEYANLIQRRMRDDFSRMTRDGFLIIRTEYATATNVQFPAILPAGTPNPDAVPLDESDINPRLRRTDEIMFFAKGQFTSIRELVDPRYVAKADAAAIYYGHGQRAAPPPGGYNAASHYYNPEVWDSGQNLDPQGYTRLGFYNAGAPVSNPNRYASDWILVRRATLLRPPEPTPVLLPPAPPVFTYATNDARVIDRDAQVSLQPAATDLFRALASANLAYPAPIMPLECFRFVSAAGNSPNSLHPQIGSALTDIATTDLSEISAIVNTADVFPNANLANFYNPANNQGPEGTNAGVDGIRGRDDPANNPSMARAQAWMNDAFPAWSMATQAQNRTRVRCEPSANNYIGILSDTATTAAEKATRRADQMMLSASNFLPRCSEFIVEWSFGLQYTSDPGDANYNAAHAGEMVWYGLERHANGQTVANFYQYPLYPWDMTETIPYSTVGGGPPVFWPAGNQDPASLFHGQGFDIPTQVQSPGQPLTSYFGYTDPRFDPDANSDGDLNDAGDSRSATIPWAWPKFIRVTISLADPADPSVEQSFQFVFDVPARNQ